MFNHTQEKGYLYQGTHYFYLTDHRVMEFNYHYHTFHKCIIVIKGDLDYTVEGRDYRLRGNDILWILPHEAHRLFVRDTTVYERVVIYVAPEFLELLNRELVDELYQTSESFSRHLRFEEQYHQEMVRLNDQLIESISSIDQRKQQSSVTEIVSSQLELNALFMKWLAQYYRLLIDKESLVEKKKAEYSTEMQVVLVFIKKNLAKSDLSIEDICKEIHLSRYHLMRKFKQATGITIYHFINNERLRLARSYMKEGYSLTDISFLVGFSDYTSFARAFKKVYAYSPKKFLKLNPSYENE